MPPAEQRAGPAAEGVLKNDDVRDTFLRARAESQRPLPWPLAGLTIVLLSLLLWAAIVAIALFAFS